MSQNDNENTSEEPKLTPLQRVKQQQAKLRQARGAGTKRGGGDDAEAGSATSGPSRRVELNRRSGGS